MRPRKPGHHWQANDLTPLLMNIQKLLVKQYLQGMDNYINKTFYTEVNYFTDWPLPVKS